MCDFLSPTAHEPRPRSDAAAHPVASSLNDPVARTISPDTETSKQLTALGSSVIRVPFPCVARWPNPKDAVTLVRAEHQANAIHVHNVKNEILASASAPEIAFVMEHMTRIHLTSTVHTSSSQAKDLSINVQFAYESQEELSESQIEQAQQQLKETLGETFQFGSAAAAASTTALAPTAKPPPPPTPAPPVQTQPTASTVKKNPYANNASGKVQVSLSQPTQSEKDAVFLPAAAQLQSTAAPAAQSTAAAAAAAEDSGEVCMGTSVMSVVGIRHYSASANLTHGQSLKLVRDANNSFDPNAIQVNTMSNQKVGHISSKEAVMVAKIMDNHKQIIITGEVAGPVIMSFPIRLGYVYNNSSKAPQPTMEHSFRVLRQCLGARLTPDKAMEQHDLKPAPSASTAVTASVEPGASTNSASVVSTTNTVHNHTVAEPVAAAHRRSYVVIGHSPITMVGMQYHNGYHLVNVGDSVKLVREPNCPQDKNAIRIDSVDGTVIGHVSAQQAKLLALIMDRCKPVKLSATIAHKGHASAVLYFVYTAKPRKVRACLRVLKSILRGLFNVGSPQRSVATSRAIQATTHSVVQDTEAKREEIDKIFEKQLEEQVSKLPNLEVPDLLSHISFFEYQKQGIAWLIKQEQGSIPPFLKPVVRQGQTIWTCNITGTELNHEPTPLRGGILGDDMGLGKTLQTCALIVANPPAPHTSYPLPSDHGLNASTAPRATLIVSPLSVCANWDTQIMKHVNRGGKNKNIVVGLYHGPDRHLVLAAVAKGEIDVLLAPYQTVASDLKQMLLAQGEAEKKHEALKADDSVRDEDEEYKNMPPKKKKKPDLWIFDLQFHRLVLDEAHTIRNGKSQMFEAMLRLNADRKLCLTGTPMVNKTEDIHSLLVFLGVEPFCQTDVFNRYIVDPIKRRREIGMDTLRAAMAFVCLRRKKQAVADVIDLVPKTVEICSIEFPPESSHKETYDTLYNIARAYFVDLLEADKQTKVLAQYMELLTLVLRIRQACNHLSLIPGTYRQRALEFKESDVPLLGKEEGSTLLSHLQGTFRSSEVVECAVCLNELDEKEAVILRKCKHIFCQACLEQIQNQVCPFCREKYTADDMVKKQGAEEASKRTKIDVAEEIRRHGRSPKVQAILDKIDEMEPSEKGVLFSQWTSMLDIMAAEFDELGMTYTRIDGTMNAAARIQAMNAFETERCDSKETPRFILCSLMACGTGINLVRASWAFMIDPWWNAAVENQAMDRIHRVGQTRPVRVCRFVMKDSIEERLATSLQEAKEALGKGSIEKLNPEEKRKARLTAMMDLFQVDQSKLLVDWK